MREMPFSISPDPRYLYLSPTHQDALQHLRYGIEEKKGFIVLTGEVGCGKTTLCRKLLEELDPENYETALILNPRMSETQMLKAILTELGETNLPSSRVDLQHHLNQLLLQLIEEEKNIILIIDESHNLDFETLEHIRLLSNLETDTQKLLQIVLMGQPELKEKLQQKRLRQLRQRIQVYYDLKKLTFDEMVGYIQHRLTTAGGMGRPQFTARACKKIFNISQGIPRIINNVCDKAVLSSYVKNRDRVTWWDVRRAEKELKIK